MFPPFEAHTIQARPLSLGFSPLSSKESRSSSFFKHRNLSHRRCSLSGFALTANIFLLLFLALWRTPFGVSIKKNVSRFRFFLEGMDVRTLPPFLIFPTEFVYWDVFTPLNLIQHPEL